MLRSAYDALTASVSVRDSQAAGSAMELLLRLSAVNLLIADR
jgi:hypothetical protein